MDSCAPRRLLPAIALVAGLALAAGARAQDSGVGCPQPRFTGTAPPEYLGRRNPLAPDADLGEAVRIFRGSSGRISCAQCHGEKGDGKGPMSAMFDPRPRNFACAATVNGIPDGQLFWIIRYGSPGTSMPPYPNLSDEQVWKMVAYLRRLAR
jgi:mono/diheme cytochrome c family protein